MKKVLVIGSGGREHALSWRLKQSPQVGEVFCSPGNGGIAEDVTCVALSGQGEIVVFCKEKKIDLVVIGAEQPLVDGLSDLLQGAGITVFGPSQKAAQLEASKGFMKELCKKYNIPTAAYGFFNNITEAKQFLEGKSFPIVVKADGLAAGKGVIIAQDKNEALAALDDMFSGKIAGGSQVVIEEFLKGDEVSFFALSDGETAIEFGYAQDHKRAFEGDTGPNTGGMGTYSPPPVATESVRKEIMEKVIFPTVAAMKNEGAPFRGVLFAGLMLTSGGVKLLEYNVRFGDPETQSLMMRFAGDLYQTLHACAVGNLGDADIRFDPRPALCVVMASKGYPGSYDKGSEIQNLRKAGSLRDVKIFHAGTQEKDGKIIAVGGRVLGVTALGDSIKEARDNAYRAVDIIDWPEGFCRRDIGFKALPQS
ncbi:MAG: phosphoribosylamine--glycine ligase [Alphaproteobacteria bacterium]|nr:phosphoribosylamine--glycine ligase [Alphaproteobacteria bacterium]